MASLSTKFKDARKKNKYTQKMIAQEIGVTRNYIALIETGKRIPSLSVLARFSRIVNLAIEDLISEENHIIEMRRKILGTGSSHEAQVGSEG